MNNKILALILVLAFCLSGCGSLSKAAINGDFYEVKELVESGERVNDIDKWGWTPLLWSIYYNNIRITIWLLDHGANPNMRAEEPYGPFLSGTTPLIVAATYGHDLAVDALLKKKAYARYKDKNGKTALEYARESGCEKCIELLQDK